MSRFRHLRGILQANWSADPAARGAAKMAAGVVLIVEGLFGPARAAASLASGSRRSVSGLVGNVVGVVVGLLFLIVPGLVDDTPAGALLEVPGTISEVVTDHGFDGEVLYGAIYTYEVAGKSYDVRSSGQSSSRPALGTTVTIGYPEADPAAGRRVDGIEGNLPLILKGAGALVLLAALASLALNVALLVIGVKLFRDGRRDRSEGATGNSWLSDLVRLVRTTDRATLDVAWKAAGISGPAPGSTEASQDPSPGL